MDFLEYGSDLVWHTVKKLWRNVLIGLANLKFSSSSRAEDFNVFSISARRRQLALALLHPSLQR